MWHKLINTDLISEGTIVRKRISMDAYDGFKVFRVTKIDKENISLLQTHLNNEKLQTEMELVTTLNQFFCENCCDIWSGVENVFQEDVLDKVYSH